MNINTNIEAPANTNHTLQKLVPPAEHFITLIDQPACSMHVMASRPPQPVTIIDAAPISAPSRAFARRVRNGKIARLPKLYRDLVNDLLFKNMSHSKIANALGEHEVYVTERNISNWKTRGGYAEWREEQERQLQLARAQDNLTDYLRKNDAAELPEVGLQVAATQLSQMLLNPEKARELAADPKQYAQVVDMLCRLANQLKVLQCDRDKAVKDSSHSNTLEFSKRRYAEDAEITRKVYSSELGDGPKDPDIPHRNELPDRDPLHYHDYKPRIPTALEIMQGWKQALDNRAEKQLPAIPSGTAPTDSQAQTKTS